MRSAYGGVREMVLGMKIVQPDGTVSKSGGKVVKNVQGYDLHRLHTGAMGTLGVIAEIAFKLVPIPARTRTIAAWFEDLEGAAGAARYVLAGSFSPEALSVHTGPRATAVVRTLSSAGGTADASHLLLIRLAGGPATVDRQSEEVTGTAGSSGASGYEVLEGEDAAGAWDRIATGGTETLVAVRATFKPAIAFEYLAALEREYAGGGPLSFDGTVEAGFGTVLAEWTSREEDDAMAAVATATAEARSRGTAAVVEKCPVSVKKAMDVYDGLGPEFSVMRRLKEEFDPGRNLSPGRYAGRI